MFFLLCAGTGNPWEWTFGSLSCGGRTSFPKGCVAKSQCPSSVFGGTGHPWKCTSAKSSVIGWQDLPFQIYTDINIKVGLEGLGFRVFI